MFFKVMVATTSRHGPPWPPGRFEGQPQHRGRDRRGAAQVDVLGATAAAGDQDAAGETGETMGGNHGEKPWGETMVNCWLYGRLNGRYLVDLC